MPQPSFTSLAVHQELADESLPKSEAGVLIFEGKQSALLAHVKSGAKTYGAPVNFIPDEADAFLAALESAYLTETNSSDPMDLDTALVPVSCTIFEPARCLKEFAPPKRFYRTFWRSIAKRILALSHMQTM